MYFIFKTVLYILLLSFVFATVRQCLHYTSAFFQLDPKMCHILRTSIVVIKRMSCSVSQKYTSLCLMSSVNFFPNTCWISPSIGPDSITNSVLKDEPNEKKSILNKSKDTMNQLISNFYCNFSWNIVVLSD